MQNVREQFSGYREPPVREYRTLRTGPGEEYPETGLPRVGLVSDTDVWAHYQIGVGEFTWELVAAAGCMVEDIAVAGLRKGEYALITEPDYGPPVPAES